MPDIIDVSDSVSIVVHQPAKSRLISETSTISETLRAYKNDQELVAAPPPEVPTPQNIIGFRQRAVRIPKHAPRAILIEAELTNLLIAPLKLLSFSDGINTAIAGIRPQLVHNVALSRVILARSHPMLAHSQIKIQSQPMVLKARLALLSSPNMWARSKLKTRPETQSIHALKAVNFDKMHKLTRIIKIAMLAQSL